jgi:hypothetical protein
MSTPNEVFPLHLVIEYIVIDTRLKILITLHRETNHDNNRLI